MAYTRTDLQPIGVFSNRVSIHHLAEQQVTATFSFAQRVEHLLTPGIRDDWIRVAHAPQCNPVPTMHTRGLRNTATRNLPTTPDRQTLSLIAAGFATGDITDQLSISVNTVTNHRSNMLIPTLMMSPAAATDRRSS